jgi:electron transfer flavoprotein alpha subunit
MALLLIAEHDNDTLRDATSKTLTAALQISDEVDVLVAGHNAGGAAKAAAALPACARCCTATPRCSSARWPSRWRRWWCR